MSYAFLAGAMAVAPFNIHGQVVDLERNPLEQTTITLVCGSDTSATTSNSNGVFTFAVTTRASRCSLAAQRHGYESLRLSPVLPAAGETVNVTFVMRPSSPSSLTVLGSVLVNGASSASATGGETAEIQASSLTQYGSENFNAALAAEPGVNLPRPAGGVPGAPTVISLRGPDPSETLVEVDGHPLNSGAAGGYDLTLLDSSALSSVQVVYGIGPSSLVGVNTLGGAVNFRTLDPTETAQERVRLTAGSFGTVGETIQATGSEARLGYAVSLHRLTSTGLVRDFPIVDENTGALASIGSGIAASSELVKLRVAFGTSAGYGQLTYRGGTSFRDVSALLSAPATIGQPGTLFSSFAGSTVQTVSPAIGVDVRLPLGSSLLTLRHQLSINNQTVTGPAANFSPFFLNARDSLADDSLLLDVPTSTGSFAVAASVLSERLTAPGAFSAGSSTQAEVQRSLLVREIWNPTAHLHYTAATYLSRFDTFGSSVDPRAALTWTPSGVTSVRASIGTTFQAPLLTERFVPSPLPTPDARRLIHVGNPNLQADHATEYEVGTEHVFGSGLRAVRASVNGYRTNLRTPALVFMPVVPPGQTALSYPINVSDAVYRGFDVRLDVPLSKTLTASAAYGVSSAFLLSVPPGFGDPDTSNLVPRRQLAGVPLQRGHLTFVGGSRLHWRLETEYESGNNELNRPAFAALDAGVLVSTGHVTYALSGTNLTGVYADRFLLPGQGVMPGTDAFSLSPPAIALTIVTSL